VTILEVVELRVPPSAFEDARVQRFTGFLEERGMEVPTARRYVEAILSALLVEIRDTVAVELRAHVERIGELRTELRSNYEGVLEHLAQGREVPPEITPGTFASLFSELAGEMEALRDVERSLLAGELPQPVEQLRPAFAEDPTEHGLPPAELAPPQEEVLVGTPRELAGHEPGGAPEAEATGVDPELPLDPAREAFERQAGLHEQQRAGRAQVRERVVEDPQVAEAAQQQLETFARRHGFDAFRRGARRPRGSPSAPRRWSVSLEFQPRQGPFEAQLRAMSELDPQFAARGYGVVFRFGRRVVKPDGVIQSTGQRFRLGEFKEPLGPQPRSFYDSEAGRQKLFEDIWERTQMSMELPDCDGWTYDTGAEWLDQVIYDIVHERLGPELAGRVLVPRAKVK
jgi:hypothetical protein